MNILEWSNTQDTYYTFFVLFYRNQGHGNEGALVINLVNTLKSMAIENGLSIILQLGMASFRVH